MERYFFEKLTPTKNANISIYDEAIEFVFKNSDVTNVAISGPYGAGKSSVVESYENKHKEKKFLYISLGQFTRNYTQTTKRGLLTTNKG